MGSSQNIGSYDSGASPSMEEVMRITLSHSNYFNFVSIPGPGGFPPSRYISADLIDFNPARQVHVEARNLFGRGTALSAFVSLDSGDRRVGMRGSSHEPNAALDSQWLRLSRFWVENPWESGEVMARQLELALYHRFSVHSPGFFNLDEDRMETDGIVEWVTQLLINRPELDGL